MVVSVRKMQCQFAVGCATRGMPSSVLLGNNMYYASGDSAVALRFRER
jgi:hypothetical protein